MFLGDGYQASEISSTYATHVQELVSYLFTGGQLTEPFGRYQNFFNIYRVDVVSAQSGADDPSGGITVDTALNATYKYDGVTDRLLYIDNSLADSALSSAISGSSVHPDMKFVTVNASKYGGGGGKYAVYAGGNSSSLEIAVHEIGHSFAGLADQYDYGGPTAYTGLEPSQPDITTDPTGAKWANWIGYDQPGIGTIGAYEGGGYSKFGIYRPSMDSKMRDLNNPFDAIGREEFIRDFYQIVHPLDAYTDNSVALTDPAMLMADVIDTSVIFNRWTVDGQQVSDMHVQNFTFENFNIPSGHHTVDLLAYDPTDWVRGDRSALQQQVNWDVTLAHAVLHAGPGDHVIHGGPLVDTIHGSPGMDSLFGANGDDSLIGGGSADRLKGGAGGDVLAGGGGADVLLGDRGDDTLDGGARGDTLDGGDGADLLHGGSGFDHLSGGAGRDSLHGEGGGDVLIGNAGHDMLAGNAGGDRLAGGSDNDVLYGGRGNDVLIGGGGRDAMKGGPGHDTFQFNAVIQSGVGPSLRDRIGDFTPGTDKIDLTRIDADTHHSGDDAFTFIGSAHFTHHAGELRAVAFSGVTVIAGDVNGDAAADFQIALIGHPVLSGGDFLL